MKWIIIFLLLPSLAMAGQGMGPGPGVKAYSAGGGAAPVFRSGSEAAYANSESSVWTKPAGTAENDILVAILLTYSDAAVTPPSGFTQIELAENNASGKEHRLYAWWKRAGASEPANYTFSWTGVTEHEGYMLAVSGCTTSGTPADINANAVNETFSGSYPVVSGTTTTGNVLLIYAGGNHDGGSATPPTGFTERFEVITLLEVATNVQVSAGATGNISATGAVYPSSSILIGLKP